MGKVKINIPEKALFLLTEKARYKVLVGGRGSGKSISAGLVLLIKGTQKKIRVLCTRQIQTSIRDSVHKLLSDLISQYGLDGFYTITQDSIKGINGTEFIFKGLKNNISEIKSTQGINYAWIEEAESITDESWDVLIPTIREPESEIWITFNPNMKSDATYQRFVVNKPENCITVEMNYTDNPFFPDVLREEMEFCKKLNYPKYEHIWLGIPNAEAGNLIKMSMFQRYKQPPERFDGLFITCDTAFSEKKSADSSAFLLGGVKGKQKYILDVYCKKVTFVDLCRDLKSFYLNAVQKYGRSNNLDAIYIENKASGISLIQQLRAEGMPILELTPTVHNEVLKKDIVADKYTRFLEIEAELDSGNVSIPESSPWMPEFERQCEAFTGGKQEEHDDVCFVAGTMIKTQFGDKPIEELKVGDKVITPFGLRKIECVKQTGRKKVIYNKNLNLCGTPKHKVLTITSGYDNLCDIDNIGDTLKWNLKNLIIWKIRSLLYLTEKNIAEWGERESISYLMRAGVRLEKIQKVCMWRFGNMSIKERFPKVMLFIIRIIIHLTTSLIIWSVYHFGNIWNYTKKIVKDILNRLNPLNILTKLGIWRVNGINQKQAENGTKSMPKKFWKIKKKKEFAKIADANLRYIIFQKEKAMSLTEDGAKNAMVNTGKDYIENYKEEKLPVYNLKVDGGVYFANKTLVSNCDVLIYFLKMSKKYGGTNWDLYKQAFRR